MEWNINMDLTKEEIDWLEQEKQAFRQQVEHTLRRKLTDKSWQAYVPQFTFADVAKHAAKKGQRRNLRNQNNEYRIAKLFRENKNNYKIEKLWEYHYSKFDTTRYEYKIYGDIDLFQMHTLGKRK